LPAWPVRRQCEVVGDGRNHWPAVHVDDLATAYLSAVERAASGDGRVTGQIFNVVAEDAVAVAEMGEAIRASVGADRVEPWPLDDARNRLDRSLTHWRSTRQ
jgi:Predicted nucleoside-diphosphate sugar epimerase